jgi:hypothetical protein
MTTRVLPFSAAAQAYGQSRPLSVKPVAQARSVSRPQSQDTFDLSAAARARSQPAHPLAAAKVQVAIDFNATTPAQAPGAMPIYSNPADRNVAATGINAGRLVDTEA